MAAFRHLYKVQVDVTLLDDARHHRPHVYDFVYNTGERSAEPPSFEVIRATITAQLVGMDPNSRILGIPMDSGAMMYPWARVVKVNVGIEFVSTTYS